MKGLSHIQGLSLILNPLFPNKLYRESQNIKNQYFFRYDGVCDKDGCDFGSWRLGDHEYYGPGSEFKIDTTKPFTVVTQFITSDGTANGDLISVRRKYVQDGNVIENSKVGHYNSSFWSGRIFLVFY